MNAIHEQSRPISRWHLYVTLLGVVVLAIGVLSWPHRQPAAVRVIDGDTIALGGSTRIRLYGIDAPESRQTCLDAEGDTYPCGDFATVELASIIGQTGVVCEVLTHDRYGREVCRCSAPGRYPDIGREMVRRGWALADLRYSRDYLRIETQARWQRAGLWVGEFQDPADFRKSRRSR